MQLFEMAELCLRANGERLDARITREFRDFDHLAPDAEPAAFAAAPARRTRAVAAAVRADQPELAAGGLSPAARRLHRVVQSAKRAVEHSVAPLLKRQEERERRWLAAKAREAQQWRQEHHLLTLYCHLLHMSGFQLCSQAHADEHAEMQSSMGIGVRVDWSSLDSGMLTRFDAYGPTSPYSGVTAPSGGTVFDNKRVLIAVKGHVVRERKAFFYADKLDELLRRASLRILRAGLARVANPSWVQELSGDTSTSSSSDARARARARARAAVTEQGTAAASLGGDGCRSASASPAAAAASASASSNLDRLTVRDLRLDLLEFLRSSTLREPCYSDVLVIFRRQAQWDTDDATLNPRNMFLRHYRRVPLADLTLLMPDKRPAMRAVDRLTCGSYSLTAVLAAVPLLSSAHLLPFMDFPLAPALYSSVEPFSWTWILAASTFTAAVSKVFFRYRMTKSYYHEAVNSHAARNSANSDGGVLSFLVEQAVEEQFKRAVAIYTALAVPTSDGMSASQIRHSLHVLLAQETAAGAPQSAVGTHPHQETHDVATTGTSISISRRTSASARTPAMTGIGDMEMMDGVGGMGAVALPWPQTDKEVAAMMDALAPLGLWQAMPSRVLRRSSNTNANANAGSNNVGTAAGERRWRSASVEDARSSIRECWTTLLEGPPLADNSWPWSGGWKSQSAAAAADKDSGTPPRWSMATHDDDDDDDDDDVVHSGGMASPTLPLDTLPLPPQWGEGIIFGLAPDLPYSSVGPQLPRQTWTYR
jgi:hypothetical protein